MTKEELIYLVINKGWKPWGKPKSKPGNNSVYQCYRRKNEYIWIGNTFIERFDCPHALDYMRDLNTDIMAFIN